MSAKTPPPQLDDAWSSRRGDGTDRVDGSMSLFAVMTSRARRGVDDAHSLYLKLRRGIVTFSTAKVVLVAPKGSNGRHPAPAEAAVAPAPLAPTANTPAVVPPPASELPTVRGTVIRRSSPIFGPADGEGTRSVPVRSGSRDANIVIGERGASGARLQEARRLNRIAIVGVAVGVLNLAGLVVAILFAGAMFRALALTAQSSGGGAKIDQRAWLGTAGVRLDQPYAKNNIGLTFALENSGKTPAAIEGIDETITAVDANSNRRTTIASRRLGSRTIAPGAQDALTVLEPRSLSDSAFAGLVNRRVRYEFAMTIVYRDVFGDSHQTQVCRSVEGTPASMEYGDALASCGPNTMD